MSILELIGAGTAPPEQTIKIADVSLFNMAMSIKAEKDVRYYLNYLSIDPVDKTLTASCGYSLIQTHDALDFSGYMGTKKLLIKPEQMLPKKCISAVINIDRKVIIAYTEKNQIMTIGFETCDYRYPDLSDILSDINDMTITNDDICCFNPLLLRKMNKYSGSATVVLTAHKPKIGKSFFSVKFPSLNCDYKAILMPAIP